MKKLGIILIALFVWMGINAEPQQTIPQTDTAKTAVVNKDSIEKLYMNKNLDPKEAILLQKLTPNQIMELEKQRMDNDKINDMPFSKFGLLAVCITPFIMVVLIILFLSMYKNKESIRKHELFMKALEAGQPIPESYFKEPIKKKSSSLQKGVICLMLGIGFTIIHFAINHSTAFAIAGIILGFIGAAYLLVYLLEKPKNQLSENNE